MTDSTNTPAVQDALSPKPIGRPVAITIICVLGIVGAVFTIPMVFTSFARQIAAWYPPYLAFSATQRSISPRR